MTLLLVQAPTEEPVSLAEAKAHARVDHAADDTLISALVPAVRDAAESATRRAFVSQTWELRLDRFPCGRVPIELPKPPLASVTYVQYVDVDGVTQTWASSEYQLSIPTGDHAERGRLFPAYGKVYPSTRCVPDAVVVRFVCGYGAASAVPKALKQAMLLKLGDLYSRRESGIVGTIFTETGAAAALLSPFRSFDF